MRFLFCPSGHLSFNCQTSWSCLSRYQSWMLVHIHLEQEEKGKKKKQKKDEYIWERELSNRFIIKQMSPRDKFHSLHVSMRDNTLDLSLWPTWQKVLRSLIKRTSIILWKPTFVNCLAQPIFISYQNHLSLRKSSRPNAEGNNYDDHLIRLGVRLP